MSLIHCTECNNEISDKAPSCVHCGNPLSEDKILKMNEVEIEVTRKKIKMKSLIILLVVSFFMFIVMVTDIPFAYNILRKYRIIELLKLKNINSEGLIVSVGIITLISFFVSFLSKRKANVGYFINNILLVLIFSSLYKQGYRIDVGFYLLFILNSLLLLYKTKYYLKKSKIFVIESEVNVLVEKSLKIEEHFNKQKSKLKLIVSYTLLIIFCLLLVVPIYYFNGIEQKKLVKCA